MPRRPKKPPWNKGKNLFPELYGGPKHVVPPMPPPSGPAATLTTGRMVPQEPEKESTWECLLCLQLADGAVPTVPEHALRCPKRNPAVKS
jgi:hypothetical protein